MARNETSKSENRVFQEIAGILLLSLALLLLVALFSYDRADLAFNRVPANEEKHNWIGLIGAWGAHALFLVCGAAAYLLPVLALGFGLSFFLPSMAYLRQVWPWTIVLVVASASLLDFYKEYLGSLQANLDSGSPGGLVGVFFNKSLFRFFGRVGAPILLVTLYFVSLLFLTNQQLFEWCRTLWRLRSKASATDFLEPEAKLAPPPTERRPRPRASIEKAAKELPAESDAGATSGLGQDLQPVPEPTVRDLSVPTARGTNAAAEKAKRLPSPSETTPSALEPVPEGAVISAREIAAATTIEILGAAGSAANPEPKEKVRANEPASISRSASDEAADVITPPAPSQPPEASLKPILPTTPAASAELAPRPRPSPKKPKPLAVASTPQIGNYKLPVLDYLHHADPNIKPTETKEELMANARLMQLTLAQFGIEVALGDITKGPTITRYELHPAPGVKLEKISALTNNIAAALKAERIYILAPVPGKSSVGVEVPNAVKTKVIMRDLLETEEWTKTKAKIPLALGKDVYGHPIIADLAEMPHLLIAGSTGSGKSVCINAIIASLLYKFGPDQLRFVMIDPKVVELQQYNSLPHLVVPVVNDPKKVILALRWVVNEMEKRYQIFARVGVRNIKSFNERPKDKPLPVTHPELPLTSRKEKIEPGAEGFAVEVDEEIVVPRDEDIVIPESLSYIVVIIDELADLMLVAPADVEMAIARITQMARAAGIHCIVATQRPSVDVITGVIKANIPARIAFQVAAKVDSRTILDSMGADKLLGKGDMLYLPPGSARLTRAQGVLITDQEIQSIVDCITGQSKPSYELEIHQQLSRPVANIDTNAGESNEDEALIEQCIEVIRSEQKASVSLLQRRLRLGYTRAARIMDELENRGIVGPSKGAEPRDILFDLDAPGAAG